MINRLSIKLWKFKRKIRHKKLTARNKSAEWWDIVIWTTGSAHFTFTCARLVSTVSAISNLIQFPTNLVFLFSVLFSIFVHFLSFKRFIKSKAIAHCVYTVNMISNDYVYFQYKFNSNGKINGNDKARRRHVMQQQQKKGKSKNK